MGEIPVSSVNFNNVETGLDSSLCRIEKGDSKGLDLVQGQFFGLGVLVAAVESRKGMHLIRPSSNF